LEGGEREREREKGGGRNGKTRREESEKSREYGANEAKKSTPLRWNGSGGAYFVSCEPVCLLKERGDWLERYRGKLVWSSVLVVY